MIMSLMTTQTIYFYPFYIRDMSDIFSKAAFKKSQMKQLQWYHGRSGVVFIVSTVKLHISIIRLQAVKTGAGAKCFTRLYKKE